MNSSSPKSKKFKTTGEFIDAQSPQIIRRWEQLVKRQNVQANRLSRPILIDTLPECLKEMANEISVCKRGSAGMSRSTVALEHGGERARVTDYDPQDVIEEYQLLRQAIFEIIRDEMHQAGGDEVLAVHGVIDRAMHQSVSGFALTQLQLREQFIALLTHDLRSPLSNIEMASEIAMEALHDTETLKGLLEKIQKNVIRGQKMIADLLDVIATKSGSRIDLQLSICEIEPILSDIVNQFISRYGNRFQLNAVSQTGWWDDDALRRAIENLVMNAVKYGDPHTQITISAVSEDGRLVISVHNFGNPIPSEDQPAVFQAFRRSPGAKDGKQKGWGLGLALVRSIAEAHNGSIFLESEAQRGTTFKIDIPIDSRPSALSTPIL